MKQIKIAAASDLHYISPELTDHGELFMRVVRTEDAKLSECSDAIMEALTECIIRENPDICIIPGDLTFNGERKSLEGCMEYLKKIRDAGIPVLVIPGNHDIANRHAAEYRGNARIPAETISPEMFLSLAGEFGYADAQEKDAYSMSYLFETEELGILMLDANTREYPGGIRPETLEWAEKVLQKSEERGIPVISVTHQNVICQNPFMDRGFVLDNHQAVKVLLNKYHVPVNLSGHCHMMHTAVSGDLRDISVGSLMISPLHYGILMMPEGKFETKRIGILEQEAYSRFREAVGAQIRKELDARIPGGEDNEKMAEFSVRANHALFSGNTSLFAQLRQDEVFDLWKKKAPDAFWLAYMKTYLCEDREYGKDSADDLRSILFGRNKPFGKQE
ncbi:MAG: metallophosphoesterase [Solobacterium sp.]|nr:metallophosphoesterase [Solobacterium sp.]